jgi:hypothetical protein
LHCNRTAPLPPWPPHQRPPAGRVRPQRVARDGAPAAPEAGQLVPGRVPLHPDALLPGLRVHPRRPLLREPRGGAPLPFVPLCDASGSHVMCAQGQRKDNAGTTPE